MTDPNKRVVRYTEVHFYGNTDPVGHSVLIVPVDHPDTHLVTNGQPADTSAVVAYDETTGFIETQNTLYIPA